MPKRRLPTQPDLEALNREATELLKAFANEDEEAVADFRNYHPTGVAVSQASLDDARLVLARSYRFASWSRLELAAELCQSIYDSDEAAVGELLTKNPNLIDEPARGSDTGANWGTPLSYASYLGRPGITNLLIDLSGHDDHIATERALEVGRKQLAEWFIGENGTVDPGAVMNPCETLNADGLRFLLRQGGRLSDSSGNPLAPVATILQTYSRYPEGKHECLAICQRHGIDFPKTPMMAFHQGRIDLLEQHLAGDADLVHQRFLHDDIYPIALGCVRLSLAYQ